MPERNLVKENHFVAPEDVYMYIVGIDPGVTTGVSIIGIKDSEQIPLPAEIEYWGSTQYSYGGSGNDSDILAEEKFIEHRIAARIAYIIRKLAKASKVVVVAIEDFIIRKMNTSRDFLAPVRITAAIVQELYKVNNIHFFYWSPADAKSVCTDKRMNTWGYEIRTQKDRHSRDADRHAVLSLRKLKEKPALLREVLSKTS